MIRAPRCRRGSRDSCCRPPALLRDFFERATSIVQDSLPARIFLPPPHDYLGVSRIDLHQPRLSLEPLAADQRRTGPAEQVNDDIAGLAAVQQRPFDQLDRLHRRVQPIASRLVFLPERALGAIAVPSVALPGQVRIEDWLVAELVAPKAPREGILGPDDLATYFKTGAFNGVLEFPLPRRWVAHVQGSAGFDDGSTRLEGLGEELLKLIGCHAVPLNR